MIVHFTNPCGIYCLGPELVVYHTVNCWSLCARHSLMDFASAWHIAQGASAEWTNVFAQKLLHFLGHLWLSSYSGSNFPVSQFLLKLHAWYKQPISESCYYCESTSGCGPFVAGKVGIHLLHGTKVSHFYSSSKWLENCTVKRWGPVGQEISKEMGGDIWERRDF